MIISNRLLGEVLKVNICVEDMQPHLRENMLIYDINELITNHINIYELAYKCKEWAYGQELHFEIESRIIINNTGGYDALPVGYACVLYDNMPYYECKCESETIAIFKACQWILENKTNKEG